MRVCCGLLGNLILEARLAAEEAETEPGRTVIVLESEEVLLPEDAEFGLVEAMEEERGGRRQAGYSMPDWDPSQAKGCPPLA